MDRLRALWKFFAQTPDDFAGRPYEGALNQLGHWTLGLIATALVCAVWAACFGEMPVKWGAFVGVTLFYFVFVEIISQGWQRIDTVVDTFFFAFGAGSPLLAMTESSDAGEKINLSLDHFNVLAIASCLFVSLLIYAWRRI